MKHAKEYKMLRKYVKLSTVLGTVLLKNDFKKTCTVQTCAVQVSTIYVVSILLLHITYFNKSLFKELIFITEFVNCIAHIL